MLPQLPLPRLIKNISSFINPLPNFLLIFFRQMNGLLDIHTAAAFIFFGTFFALNK